MYNIKEKVSKLTTINEDSLDKVNDLVRCCIADAVFETHLNDGNSTNIDLGYGTLTILKINNEIHYKFVPNAKLEESIVDAVTGKKNELDDVVLDRTTKTLLATYKDLF